jgi:hypothetical protein
VRAERNVWDTTKMAGLVSAQQWAVNIQSYRKWLPLDADANFRTANGSWENSGTIGRVWRSTNDTNAIAWNVKKPEDWIRGVTLAYVWCTPRATGAFEDDIDIRVKIELSPVGTDYEITGSRIVLMDSTPGWTLDAGEEDLLQKVEHVGEPDVSHGEDGILIVRLLRVADTSDETLDIYGVELIHYPTIER